MRDCKRNILVNACLDPQAVGNLKFLCSICCTKNKIELC